MPDLVLAARLLEDPLADRHDQARVLERGEELVRCHQAPLGIGPAQQCLDADQLVVVEGHHRQVEQPELVALERLAQAALGGGRAHRRAHREVEHRGPPGVVALGLLHGDAGVVEDVAGLVVAAVDHGDADPGGHLHEVGADAERHGQHLGELGGPALGHAGVGRARSSAPRTAGRPGGTAARRSRIAPLS